MSKVCLLAICAWMTLSPAPEKQHEVHGIVVAIDKKELSLLVSCEPIPGYMDAMEMSFKVHDSDVLSGLIVGTAVHFTMVEDGSHVFAEQIRVVKDVNGEAEPTEAARLEFLSRAMDRNATTMAIRVGEVVPNFALSDQKHHLVHLAEFSGKTVVLTFSYSRCPNPNYCFRLSNNLAQLQRRFAGREAEDLALITILIDPANDQGATLDSYSGIWKADSARWHFLTGRVDQVRTVAALFGMEFWSDEGLLTHGFHTIVIDRDGRLAANLEGNQFTAKQLGDLVESVSRGQAKLAPQAL